MKAKFVCGLLAAVSVCVVGGGFAAQTRAQQAVSAKAELAAKGTWSAATTYAVDDIVTARGSAWISLKANNTNKIPGQTGPMNTAAWWQLFARGFNLTGAWSNATTYQPDDLVTYLGQTYRAKATNLNKQPPNGPIWELLASKGAAGPNTGIGTGSASAPSISFNGDPNTGIFSPQAGQIALVQDGDIVFRASTPTFDNTAVGRNALKSVTGVGTSNTALGAYSAADLTTGQNNIAIGRSALGTATTANNNISIGNNSMLNTDTATENVAVGNSTLAFNTTGSSNVALGSGAAANTNIGSANVAVGHSALVDNNSGDRNVALGRGALENNTTGSDNIAIGDQAGTSAPVGSNNNIIIGNSGSGFNNAIVIGGAQTTTQIAGIHNQTSTGGIAVLVNSSGRLGTSTSSRRFKQDIETMAEVSDMLAKLRPVTFRYKEADETGAKPLQYGLIAEEVEAVFPDLVAYDNEGRVHTVKYHLLPSFLLAGYQAQQKKIEALEDRLRRLETLLPQTKAASLQ